MNKLFTGIRNMKGLSDLITIGRDIIPYVDWRDVLSRSDLALRILSKPEARVLIESLLAMRDPLAAALLETGEITEEEAGPTGFNKPGLGLAELIRIAFAKDEEGVGEEDGGGG